MSRLFRDEQFYFNFFSIEHFGINVRRKRGGVSIMLTFETDD